MTTGSGMKFYKDGELTHELKAEGTFATDSNTPRPNLGEAVKETQPELEQRMRIDGAGHVSPKPWPTQFDNDPSRWYEQIGKLPKREWVGLTDEEVEEMIVSDCNMEEYFGSAFKLYRKIEAKLKEKNHGNP
jgi:hypothetical protein